MEFSWEAATDDNTPVAGLTYALRIGSKPGGQEYCLQMPLEVD